MLSLKAVFGNMFREGGEKGADFSMGRMLAGGLGATALAMPFMGGKEEEEVPEEQMPGGGIADVDMREQVQMRANGGLMGLYNRGM